MFNYNQCKYKFSYIYYSSTLFVGCFNDNFNDSDKDNDDADSNANVNDSRSRHTVRQLG